jgi:hypothetical protein
MLVITQSLKISNKEKILRQPEKNALCTEGQRTEKLHVSCWRQLNLKHTKVKFPKVFSEAEESVSVEFYVQSVDTGK